MMDNCVYLSNLEPLAYCTNLRKLKLSSLEAVDSFTQLAVCSGLERLQVDNNYSLTSISGLESLHNLEVVILLDCPSLANLEPLGACPKLRHLHVERVSAAMSYTHITQCTSLESLYLGGTGTQVPDLSRCLHLRSLRCHDVRGVTAPLPMSIEAVRVSNARHINKSLVNIASVSMLRYLDMSDSLRLKSLQPLTVSLGLRTLLISHCTKVTSP